MEFTNDDSIIEFFKSKGCKVEKIRDMLLVMCGDKQFPIKIIDDNLQIDIDMLETIIKQIEK